MLPLSLSLDALALLALQDSSEPAVQVLWQRPIVMATAIVVAALLLARVFDWMVNATLRALAARTRTRLDDEILDSLHKPVVNSVVLVGLWLACNVLATEASPLTWAYHVIVSLFVFVWIAAALRVSGRALRAMSGDSERFRMVQERTLPLFENLAKVLLIALAVYLLMEEWELDATGWIASAGVAGIVLGLAAKDSLANLFAGVSIIADAPYHVGDYIVLDSGQRGRVLHIGLRSTLILTRDDVQISIPNSLIGNSSIVNESSGKPQYRLRVQVGVAYGSDIERVRSVLLEVAAQASAPLEQPEARVRFRRFGESTLDFELLVWIRDPELRGRVLDELNTAVYTAFGENGIEIAFPQRDLHVRSLPEGWSQTAASDT